MNNWIEPSVERYEKQKLITNEIDKHLEILDKWSAPRSTHKGIEIHPSFIILLNMGDKIVNYLIHCIIESGWSHANYILLDHLVGNKIPTIPDEHRGRVPFLMAHIILWWINSEYYANDNVYFGLVD